MHRKLLSESRFSQVRSTVNHERSKFDLSHGHHSTMNAGLLYPHFIREVLPGDTFEFSASFVNRMSTPFAPIMDTAFLDQWYFYVPQRLVWEHTKEFYGENNSSAWTQDIEYFIPRLSRSFKSDGVGDHFGIPTLTTLAVNALPLRAYRLIWNEWFRDQNTQDPKLVNMGDTETDGTLDDLLPVNKRKDYFTTALPEPQKGPDVLLPMGGYAPVITTEEFMNLNGIPLVFYNSDQFGGDDPAKNYSFAIAGNNGTGDVSVGDSFDYAHFGGYAKFGSDELEGNTPGGENNVAVPVNLMADFSTGSIQSTINDLRQAFAIQSLFELDARGGSRYREFIKAHFGVNVPDLTVQVPEFLGGSSDPIVVNQVVQTSSTVSDSPQGTVAAFSKTVGKRRGSFVKSFSEPGYVIGVCAIRTLQSYQDGLDRMWSRRSRLDFYHPVLAHIGEMPIYNKELYVYDDDKRDEVFGYQEAWAEYRFAQSYVSGAFRSNYPSGSLDFWTFTNDFESLPVLSDGFIRETDVNVGRTLVTTDMEGAPQFIVDWWFDLGAYRVMPMFGTPAILGGRQ